MKVNIYCCYWKYFSCNIYCEYDFAKLLFVMSYFNFVNYNGNNNSSSHMDMFILTVQKSNIIKDNLFD